MKKQYLVLFILCFVLIGGAVVSCNAESLEMGLATFPGDSEGEGTPPEGGATEVAEPTFAVASIAAEPGATVVVPITFTNDTEQGLCGVTIRLSYDSALTLTNVRSGSAFSTLVFTRPGNYSTLTPVLLWDGLEEDRGVGEIAYLTFQAPEADGVYNITARCEAGDVIDGNLNDIDVAFISGGITIASGASIEPDFILPASLTYIDDEAFMGCNFAYVKLSENVACIGKKAFAYCSNLKHIYIPEETATIEADAFEGVTNALVIHGAAGSVAEEYAAAHGFAFQGE